MAEGCAAGEEALLFWLARATLSQLDTDRLCSALFVHLPHTAAADAAQVAADVSFSYNAAQFLFLRIGLLGGRAPTSHDLVALEAGVQKVCQG